MVLVTSFNSFHAFHAKHTDTNIHTFFYTYTYTCLFLHFDFLLRRCCVRLESFCCFLFYYLFLHKILVVAQAQELNWHQFVPDGCCHILLVVLVGGRLSVFHDCEEFMPHSHSCASMSSFNRWAINLSSSLSIRCDTIRLKSSLVLWKVSSFLFVFYSFLCFPCFVVLSLHAFFSG